MRPDFPLIWDNTMRSTLVECPRKFMWEFMRHFKRKGENIHLHAGGAWAYGLEIARMAYYHAGLSALDAQAAGLEALIMKYGNFDGGESNKSLPRLIEAFTYYFNAFPLESDPAQPYRGADGKPMVEFSFAHPLDIDHPVTGEPLIYVGRADMVATYAGAVSIYDDKTTSALGASWASQWDRRAQFTGYLWAARKANLPATQVLVRGIAILKREVKHAEVISVRTQHHIDEWHFQIHRDLKRAIEMWKEGYWDVNLADSCSSYGGCLFKQPCMSNNPEPWLTGGNYSIRVWNPATREEMEIPA